MNSAQMNHTNLRLGKIDIMLLIKQMNAKSGDQNVVPIGQSGWAIPEEFYCTIKCTKQYS